MPTIERAIPTQLLKNIDGKLHRLVRIIVGVADSAANTLVTTRATCSGSTKERTDTLAAGEHLIELLILAMDSPSELIVSASSKLGDTSEVRMHVDPPRRWRIHIVQLSHHDAGYTNLPSQTLLEHRQWLTDAIDMAKATDSYPDEAKFRIVIEQAWSLMEFLKTATDIELDKIGELLRNGTFELTALFGNLTTELCGHETLIRALYPAARIADKFRIPIESAEHNDIPGFTWGLSQVLTEAGIKIFCPGLPLYYNWGGNDLASFWNEKEIFGYEGPGAFWWQAPSGKRVLFWCNNSGCGGDSLTNLPGLDDTLVQLADGRYPYTTLRWPVGGARRDNAPFSKEYCDTIKAWNESWESPRLTMSTNARFYAELIREIPENLPVWEGEVPGQDYPVGATSTAAATAANRRNHVNLPVAEIFASGAALRTDYRYQAGSINDAVEDILWHDEHAWGHHFPAGPTARASLYEKSVHAFRAEAFLHDVKNKATARIADTIEPPKESGVHRLIVFNALPKKRSGGVRAPIREIDNCGSTIYQTVDPTTNESVRKGVLLTDRWHIIPGSDITEGKFSLIEEASGTEVAYHIEEIEGGMDALPFAAERFGLGSGTKRYGFFEDPSGLRREIVFLAADVPSCGYKSYLLVPRTKPAVQQKAIESEAIIENEYYRIRMAGAGDRLLPSIIDKRNGRDLIDPACPHRFMEILVRKPDGTLEAGTWTTGKPRATTSPVGSTILLDASVYGHPAIRYRIDLTNGDEYIRLSVRILKSPEPLLDIFLCFPFTGETGALNYEGTLCSLAPGKNLLSGAYSDELAVQNWVSVHYGADTLLWTSLDAPIANLSELWPGYTSPAHRAVLHAEIAHPAATEADFKHGWIYSRLFGNNFGTNFYVSQSGDVLFRYVFGAVSSVHDSNSYSSIGASMVTPMEAIFGTTDGDGCLPATGKMLSYDNPDLVLLTWKRAEADNGHILRFWNPTNTRMDTALTIDGFAVQRAWYADPRENPLRSEAETSGGDVEITVAPNSFVTVFISDDSIKLST